MKWSARGESRAGFTETEAFPTIIGITFYPGLNRLIKTSRKKDHTHQVPDKLQNMPTLPVNAKNGQRNPLITVESRYPANHNADNRNPQKIVENIQESTVKIPVQRKRTVAMKAEITGRSGALPATITLRGKKGPNPYRQTVMTNRGKYRT